MAAALIETIFTSMDVNGDGSVTIDQMRTVFKSFDIDGNEIRLVQTEPAEFVFAACERSYLRCLS